MILNAFLMSNGHHEASWRLPESDPTAYREVAHYQELARIAERGLMDSVFFADSPSIFGDPARRPSEALEPALLLAAMAVVTERIGLIATSSTTYEEPYNLARTFASLDAISQRKKAEMSSRIELSGVGQVFQVRSDTDKQTHEFVALDDLHLTVEAGEFVTIVGPSGCGKSTVLDLVSGLTRPSSGQVVVDGKLVTEPGLDRGVVFQQYTLLPWRTALGNVEFALEAKGGLGKAERTAVAREFLELVGLSDFENRYPHELSGGMKQRVAIARSLSYQPEVLLMDEPFGALDAQTRERLQEELVQIWKRTGTTIVFITHDIDEAVYLGQRVAVMSARPGRIREVIRIELDRDAPDEVDVRSTPEFASYRHEIWTLLRQVNRRAQLEEVDQVA